MSHEPIGGSRLDTGALQQIVKRFWGFDHLIGSTLIKVIYYVGVVGIGLFVLIGIVGGGMLGSIMGGGGGGGGFLAILLTPIIGVIQLVIWRFICEMWLLIFLIFNRLGEIRDRLPPI